MPPQAPATLPADFFSKLPPDTLPANFDFADKKEPAERPGFRSGVESGLGLPGPISDTWRGLKRLFGHPIDSAKLLLSNAGEQQLNADQAMRQGGAPSPVIQAIKEGNFANAGGQVVGGTVGGALFGRLSRFQAPAPEILPPRALPHGPIAAPGTIEATPAPAYSPTTRAQRLGLILKDGRVIELPGNMQESGAPPFAVNTTADRMGRLLPEQTPSSRALQVGPSEVPANQEAPAYPGALQKRPTDRTEIVSDKAVEDAMRNDLEKQGWRALSQERKEFYANNQPGMAKGDLITNARVEAVRTAAEQQVQKILAESNPPVKYTKTVIPKAKVTTTAQPIAEDLNSPNRLVDLMQQSVDAINARKGKK